MPGIRKDKHPNSQKLVDILHIAGFVRILSVPFSSVFI